MSQDDKPEIYFRQLLAGRQVARDSLAAHQMANFMYVIGDPVTREAMIVDPAWDVAGLAETARADGYTLTGALVTHYHPDHVGGDLWGLSVDGLATLMTEQPVPVYVNKNEGDGLKVVTGLAESDLRRVDSDEVVTIGEIPVRCLHTPGHTPGSQCFLIGDRLVAGDTLFVQACGRVDLPGGDPDAMYHSLTQKLAKLPPQTVLYPGHNYGPAETSTIGAELEQNTYLRIRGLEDWRRLMS